MTESMLINSLDSASINYQKQVKLDIYRKKSPNNRVKYYFDSYDIIKMIEGLRPYEHDFYIKGSEFKNRDTLVKALAYFGWLGNGKIGVLSGHQAEIYYNIKAKITPVQTKYDSEFIGNLLSFVELKNLNLKGDLDEDELEKELSKLRHQSANLFKVNFILDRPNWLDRADYLINKRIDFDTNGNKTDIAQSNLFKALYKYFKKERPLKTKSNFRDALALYFIGKKLQAYKKKQEGELPIYFASTTLMKGISKEKTIKDFFTIEIEAEEFSVIQDSEFIILDILYNKINNDDLLDQFVALDEIDKKGNLNIDETESIIYQDTIDNIEFQFFEKFWFRENGKKIICTAIKDFVHFEDWRNKDFIKEEKNKQRRDLLHKLSQNAASLDLMSKTWEATETFENIIKKNNFTLAEYRKSNNPFTEFGLTRFSFSNWKLIYEYINNQVFESIGDEAKRLEFQGEFISSLFKAFSNKDASELEKIVATLWVFECYHTIVLILNKFENYGNNLSLAFIHGASYIYTKSNKFDYKVLKIINQSKNLYIEREYKRSLGLSYLYFNLWNSKNDELEIVPELNYDKAFNNYQYFEKAIELLRTCVFWLKKEKDVTEDKKEYRNAKYLYSLNNFIYYVTRGGSKEMFESIESKMDLIGFERASLVKNTETFWQQRFEDTLALYYLRKAIIGIDSKEDFDDYIRQAKNRIELAISKGIVEKEKFIFTESRIINISKRYKEIKKKLSGLKK